MNKTPILALALIAAGSAASAQTLILGGGYADFSDSGSSDEGLIHFEYQHKPFYEAPRLRAGLGGSVSAHFNGDFHVGLGVYGIYDLNDRWFIEGSVMPGYFEENDSINDIGGEFQIRSLIGVGYTFDSGDSLSFAITHKSNASTSDFNPGVNAALIRFHKPF